MLYKIISLFLIIVYKNVSKVLNAQVIINDFDRFFDKNLITTPCGSVQPLRNAQFDIF